jgi:hypothetical protein
MEDWNVLCETAVKYGKSFGKSLDYSDKSIDELDKILEIYHIEFKAENASDEQIKGAALIFGAYVGQTLLKNGFFQRGYRWIENNDGIFYLKNNESGKSTDTVARVFRHLKNGAEDSIKKFYDLCFFLDEKGE